MHETHINDSIKTSLYTFNFFILLQYLISEDTFFSDDITITLICIGGWVMRSLLRLTEKWPCHVWHASLEAFFVGGLLVYLILLFYTPLSLRSPNMTEISLTGTLSLNSINQFNFKI